MSTIVTQEADQEQVPPFLSTEDPQHGVPDDASSANFQVYKNANQELHSNGLERLASGEFRMVSGGDGQADYALLFPNQDTPARNAMQQLNFEIQKNAEMLHASPGQIVSGTAVMPSADETEHNSTLMIHRSVPLSMNHSLVVSSDIISEKQVEGSKFHQPQTALLPPHAARQSNTSHHTITLDGKKELLSSVRQIYNDERAPDQR